MPEAKARTAWVSKYGAGTSPRPAWARRPGPAGRCGDGTSGSSARGSSQEASDDDPSGIATCAQAGAKFGFGLLWTALVTLPLMAAVEEICDRTALATAKSLG